MSLLARLFRCLRVDAIVEPIRIFADLSEGGNNQRPDILLRNPRGFGRQVIIDVAITGIDGQSRTSDDFPDRPLRVRHEQKKAKYGPTADRYNLQFVPAIFSRKINYYLVVVVVVVIGDRVQVRSYFVVEVVVAIINYFY